MALFKQTFPHYANFDEEYRTVSPSLIDTVANGIQHHVSSSQELKNIVNEFSVLALMPGTENWGWDFLVVDLENRLSRLGKSKFHKFMDAVASTARSLGSEFCDFVNEAAEEYDFPYTLVATDFGSYEWTFAQRPIVQATSDPGLEEPAGAAESEAMTAGIGSSTESSGSLPLGSDETAEADKCDVAVVIALKEEFRVFNDVFSGPRRTEVDPIDRQRYYLLDVAAYRIVAIVVGEMGKADAGLFCDRLIRRYSPDTVVSVGIAGAIKDDVRIGDVVSPVQIDDYIHRDRTDGVGGLRHGGRVFQCSHGLRMMMSHLEFENADALGSWASQAVEYAKPLLMDADPALLSALPFNLSPALHAESDHLASGDVVVADKQAIGWLHTRDRNIVAVEMETAGVLRSVTARDRPLASLVLRGISDSSEFSKEQSDRVKKGVLRTIAMHRACALLRLLLELDLIPRQQVQS